MRTQAMTPIEAMKIRTARTIEADLIARAKWVADETGEEVQIVFPPVNGKEPEVLLVVTKEAKAK